MIKVSELGQASTLQAVQNRIDAIQSDVAVLDSSVDSLNNDIADVDADVAVVNSKLMTSLARMDDAVAELEEYIALALRLRMEADLVREGELRVGLFQLPGAQGGYLEEVDFSRGVDPGAPERGPRPELCVGGVQQGSHADSGRGVQEGLQPVSPGLSPDERERKVSGDST